MYFVIFSTGNKLWLQILFLNVCPDGKWLFMCAFSFDLSKLNQWSILMNRALMFLMKERGYAPAACLKYFTLWIIVRPSVGSGEICCSLHSN